MNQRGFSKVELLIVGAVIGILGIFAVVAVSGARSQTRDAVRLSDIRQVQAGLELFFNDFNEYPETFTAAPLGVAATSCLGESGFAPSCAQSVETVYLERIATTPRQGLSRDSSCGDQSNAYCYVGSGGEFRIEFELERNQPLLELRSGVNCATETGWQPGRCPALTNQPPEPEPEPIEESEEVTEESL